MGVSCDYRLVSRLLDRLQGGSLSSCRADREAKEQVLDCLLLKEVGWSREIFN
jgi:hypothetical protein